MYLVKFSFVFILSFLSACAQFKLDPYQEDDFWSDVEPKQATQENQEVQRPVILPGDIAIGMNSSDVYSAWGEPRDVQNAGSYESKYQRWIYLNQSTTYWQVKNARIVYFENGKVTGWETRPIRE